MYLKNPGHIKMRVSFEGSSVVKKRKKEVYYIEPANSSKGCTSSKPDLFIKDSELRKLPGTKGHGAMLKWTQSAIWEAALRSLQDSRPCATHHLMFYRRKQIVTSGLCGHICTKYGTVSGNKTAKRVHTMCYHCFHFGHRQRVFIAFITSGISLLLQG